MRIKTIEAEYLAAEKILKLAEPLVGIGDHEKVHVVIEPAAEPERGDWPALSEEAGRELAQAVRDAFGRDSIAV